MRIKNSDDDAIIGMYFDEIRPNEPMTLSEEKDVIEKIKNGDMRARDQLISANLKFVINVAKKYKNSGVPFSDIISAGNMGLLRALEKFDSEKGVKFITYAVFWIRTTISDFIKDYRSGTYDNSLEEIYETCDDINEFETRTNSVNEDFERNTLDRYSRERVVENLMEGLMERERRILTLYFGLHGEREMNLEEISKELNITQERVRQIKDTSIRKMKYKAVCDKNFNEYKNII